LRGQLQQTIESQNRHHDAPQIEKPLEYRRQAGRVRQLGHRQDSLHVFERQGGEFAGQAKHK
jgi:hypothetical protein